MDAPVRYAKNGDVHHAYRIFGGGPRDIVLVPGTLSHVEVYWKMPATRHLLPLAKIILPRVLTAASGSPMASAIRIGATGLTSPYSVRTAARFEASGASAPPA